MDTNTRSAINRALAKAIAYRDCGQPAKAEQWAAEMVRLLECEAILSPAHRNAAAVVRLSENAA